MGEFDFLFDEQFDEFFCFLGIILLFGFLIKKCKFGFIGFIDFKFIVGLFLIFEDDDEFDEFFCFFDFVCMFDINKNLGFVDLVEFKIIFGVFF